MEIRYMLFKLLQNVDPHSSGLGWLDRPSVGKALGSTPSKSSLFLVLTQGGVSTPHITTGKLHGLHPAVVVGRIVIEAFAEVATAL
jgi:hypothetical protein